MSIFSSEYFVFLKDRECFFLSRPIDFYSKILFQIFPIFSAFPFMYKTNSDMSVVSSLLQTIYYVECKLS